jgi:hypothetical protein
MTRVFRIRLTQVKAFYLCWVTLQSSNEHVGIELEVPVIKAQAQRLIQLLQC